MLTYINGNNGDLQIIQKLNHDLFISDSSSDPELNLNWPLEKDGEDYFRRMINEEIGICFVAEDGNEVIGYLAGCISTRTNSARPVKRSEVENMLVREDYRSKGIGSNLIRIFLKWSKEKGVDKAFVIAYAPNDKAIKFYERNNFHPYSIELEQDLSDYEA